MLLLAQRGFAQGSLTPPGAPAPTFKTLDQVEARIPLDATHTPGGPSEVFRITAAGSYYLTGNMAASGKNGIVIAASGVTLDLNGFVVRGGTSPLAGITLAGNGLHDVTVRNGHVANWGSNGIDLQFGSSSVVVEDIVATSNGANGIAVSSSATIRRCIADDNALNGILAAGLSTIIDCEATANNRSNTADIAGINAGSGPVVRNCTASGNPNGAHGIRVFSGAVITDCTTSSNGGDGITGGTSNVVQRCNASFNSGDGISASGNIFGCTGSSNSGNGIAVGSSNISACTASSNKLDGIRVSTASRVADNICVSDGAATSDGAGIHATGGDNRIDNNNVTSSDRGIDISGAGNLIIRNTASGNATNYAIAANNKVGPIVLATNTASAISGSSAAGTLNDAGGGNHPWANFSY